MGFGIFTAISDALNQLDPMVWIVFFLIIGAGAIAYTNQS